MDRWCDGPPKGSRPHRIMGCFRSGRVPLLCRLTITASLSQIGPDTIPPTGNFSEISADLRPPCGRVPLFTVIIHGPGRFVYSAAYQSEAQARTTRSAALACASGWYGTMNNRSSRGAPHLPLPLLDLSSRRKDSIRACVEWKVEQKSVCPSRKFCFGRGTSQSKCEKGRDRRQNESATRPIAAVSYCRPVPGADQFVTMRTVGGVS